MTGLTTSLARKSKLKLFMALLSQNNAVLISYNNPNPIYPIFHKLAIRHTTNSNPCHILKNKALKKIVQDIKTELTSFSTL